MTEVADRTAQYAAELEKWVAGRGATGPVVSLEDALRFQRELWEANLACPGWPVRRGGRGLGSAGDRILDAVVGSAPAMRSLNIGLRMVAPTLFDHADEEMLDRYLEPMGAGQEVWCELFSEPSAGSDLAGLTTRAVRADGAWYLTGQKVWTTGAQHSHFGLVLARTNGGVPKRRGITAFVLDMTRPGIEIRPLRQITGATDFNEVFLDQVEVGDADIVGQLDGGWAVARTMLRYERAAIGASGRHRDLLTTDEILEWARDSGALEEPLWRARFVEAVLTERVSELLAARVRKRPNGEAQPSPLAPLTKLSAAGLHKQLAEVAAAANGPASTAWASDEMPRWAMATVSAPRLSIAGGTNEILRSKIAEDALGLPREPDPDRTKPFDEVLGRTLEEGLRRAASR